MAQSISQTRLTTTELLDSLREARRRTLDLVADLDDQQLIGPRLRIVNPLRWEIGHVAYFQEFWCLRHFQGAQPILAEGDRLYDSARVAHDTRWDLPLPSRQDTLAFMQNVLDRVIESAYSSTDKQIDGYDQSYFLQLALFHEQMHAEAITYTRQTLGYSAPRFTDISPAAEQTEGTNTSLSGDAHIPGGRFLLGRSPSSGFSFDNEQRIHEVEVKPLFQCHAPRSLRVSSPRSSKTAATTGPSCGASPVGTGDRAQTPNVPSIGDVNHPADGSDGISINGFRWKIGRR